MISTSNWKNEWWQMIFFYNMFTDKWRIITVFVLVVGNLVPACFSFNFPGIQKKAGSAYNLLFQVG